MPFHKVHQCRVVLGRYYYDDVSLLALLNVLIAQVIKYSSQFDMKYQLEIWSLFPHPFHVTNHAAGSATSQRSPI